MNHLALLCLVCLTVACRSNSASDGASTTRAAEPAGTTAAPPTPSTAPAPTTPATAAPTGEAVPSAAAAAASDEPTGDPLATCERVLAAVARCGAAPKMADVFADLGEGADKAILKELKTPAGIARACKRFQTTSVGVDLSNRDNLRELDRAAKASCTELGQAFQNLGGYPQDGESG